MKISFKANIEFDLKKSKKSTKKGSKNELSSVKNVQTWLLQIFAGFLVELILNELVAWIIKIFMNGSFYFYNRIFYFEMKYE